MWPGRVYAARWSSWAVSVQALRIQDALLLVWCRGWPMQHEGRQTCKAF